MGGKAEVGAEVARVKPGSEASYEVNQIVLLCLYFGLEKKGRGGGLGRLSPALGRAKRALVRGRGTRGAEKMLPEVGIQAREKGKCDLYFTFISCL